jgi:hypothetical protein
VLTDLQRTIALVALLTGMAVCAPAAATAEVVPASVAEPLLDFDEPGEAAILSDEERVTRWAHASETYPIRSAPSPSARTITRLRYKTEDKYDEVYLVLDAKVDADGQPWLHIRIPMRPNGRTGWVPADMLGPLTTVTTQLVIDRIAKKAKLY